MSQQIVISQSWDWAAMLGLMVLMMVFYAMFRAVKVVTEPEVLREVIPTAIMRGIK